MYGRTYDEQRFSVLNQITENTVSRLGVLRGQREARGMPSFGDLLTPAQAKAIQAYILFRARESMNPPPEGIR